MNWSAKVLDKSEVSSSNDITVKYAVLADNVEKRVMETTANPSVIQQEIANAVREYAEAVELADGMLAIDEVLEIITTA